MSIQVILKEVGVLTEDEVYALCSIKNQHWPHSMDSQLKWWHENSGLNDVIVHAIDNEKILGFLRLRDRVISVPTNDVAAKCITEVCVDSQAIGQGIGKEILNRTSEYLLQEGLSGYLLCEDSQVGFYKSCGWTKYKDVQLRSSMESPVSNLKSGIHCFVFSKDLSGPILLTGTVF